MEMSMLTNSSSLTPQGFHLFMDLCFRESGRHKIQIEVLDGESLVMPPVHYDLIVRSSPISASHKVWQVNSGPVSTFVIDGDFSSPVALGGYLPPFTLLFKDETNQLAFPSDRFHVTLASPGLKFKYNGEPHPEFEVRWIRTLSFLSLLTLSDRTSRSVIQLIAFRLRATNGSDCHLQTRCYLNPNPSYLRREWGRRK
jgi:hypothetical protein